MGKPPHNHRPTSRRGPMFTPLVLGVIDGVLTLGVTTARRYDLGSRHYDEPLE